MRNLSPRLIGLVVCLTTMGVADAARSHGNVDHDHRIAMLIIDADSFLVNAAIQSPTLPDGFEVEFFTHEDLENSLDSQRLMAQSDVVIIDFLGPGLVKWLPGVPIPFNLPSDAAVLYPKDSRSTSLMDFAVGW